MNSENLCLLDLQLEKAEGKQGWSSSCWVGGDFWLEAVFTCDWLLLIIFQDFGCCCVIFVWRLNVISSSRLSQKTCLDINMTREDHLKTSSAVSEHWTSINKIMLIMCMWLFHCVFSSWLKSQEFKTPSFSFRTGVTFAFALVAVVETPVTVDAIENETLVTFQHKRHSWTFFDNEIPFHLCNVKRQIIPFQDKQAHKAR